MTRLTQNQGKRLVELVHLLRPEWDIPGITAAVRKAAEFATGADVCIAACRVAANPEAETPGLIPQPGQHWQGTTTGRHQAPTPCGVHPTQNALGCPECAAIPKATPEQIAAARQLARELRAAARKEQSA